MNGTIKPSRKTGRRAAALLALVAVLLLAPAAWALGELEQKPGTAGCVSETGSGGACQDGTALDGAFDLAASPEAGTCGSPRTSQAWWWSLTATRRPGC